MSEDLIPPSRFRARWSLLAVVAGVVLVVVALVLFRSDGAGESGVTATETTTAGGGSDSQGADPSPAPPTSAILDFTTSDPSAPSNSGPTPSIVPDPSVPPITPAPPDDPPSNPVDEVAAVDALVGQGLTASEAACVVARAVQEYGTPSVLLDESIDPDVASRLFRMTQDCLFG